jgi:hypothetical protein
MDAIELIRYEIRRTWEWLDVTVSDITEEQANWNPPGLANSIAATYAHTIFAADEDFNQIYSGGKMLLRTTWADRCGLSELPPQEGEWDWSAWGRRMTMDLEAFRGYANAVWQTIEGFMERVTYEDLRREFDMSLWDLGTWTGFDFFSLHMHHPRIHGGEIATLKGLQGLPGWPVPWQSSIRRPEITG